MSIRDRILADQRREFGGSWDELVPTEGRTLGWLIESVVDDVLEAISEEEIEGVLQEHSGSIWCAACGGYAVTGPGHNQVRHQARAVVKHFRGEES